MRKLRPLVAGNWKMNGLRADLGELTALAGAYDPELRESVELLVCPPATLLREAKLALVHSAIAVGGQDCHAEPSGAFTGDLSAQMLRDAGASYAIVGHSERRANHGETDWLVRRKAEAAARAGLVPVICVGETRGERESGKLLDVLESQVVGSVPDTPVFAIAYEPVWAIGCGLTPSPADIAEAHGHIRALLNQLLPGRGESVRILYGGSVKPDNAAELMAAENVDGALVGGASLRARDFMAIAEVYRRRRP